MKNGHNKDKEMNLEDKILESLKYNEFPKIILLHGDWGCGKTYFVKKTLMPKLKGDKHYLSLYGTSSVDDFKDKLISSVLVGHENDKKYRFFKDMAFGVSQLSESGIGLIANGVSGAIKQFTMSKLDNVTFILDDLERINNDAIISQILGECYNLVETKDVTIFVISNKSEIGLNSDIEKVFLNEFKLTLPQGTIIEILNNEFPDVEPYISDKIKSLIIELSPKNIRVMKRAIGKFLRLHNNIKELDQKILEYGIRELLHKIFYICHAYYELGINKKTIKRALKNIRYGGNENETIVKLTKLFGPAFIDVSDSLLEYCCEGSYEFKCLVTDLSLPVDGGLIEMLMSDWNINQLDDNQISDGVRLLDEKLNIKTNVDDWFLYCNCYFYLVKNGIVNDAKLSCKDIMEICKSTSARDFESTEIVQIGGIKQRKSNDFDKEILKELSRVIKEMRKINNNKKLEDYQNLFEKSWHEAYNNDNHEIHNPFLHKISIDSMRIAFCNWTNFELFSFMDFINERYSIDNCRNYTVEHDNLRKVIPMIDDLIECNYPYGLKYSYLSEIRDIIVKVV